MNENTQCYYQSALKLLMPIELEAELGGFVLVLAKKRYFFCGLGTPLNNTMSTYISRNKYFTNKLLEKAGLPVPKARYIHVSDFEQGLLEEKIEGLSFPLVAKPMINGKFGEDVLCNIQGIEQLKGYLYEHATQYEFITIEEFHSNLKSYRVLIFNHRILGVVLRHPAHVIGDGQHTIEELVDITNMNRSEISDVLKPIIIDEECHIRLNELGIDTNYIPKKDDWITLCYTCNASRGGTYISLDKKICNENNMLLINAAKALNLNLVGFDVLCADINLPIVSSGGVIIESNDSPSVRIHEQAIEGNSVLVTRKIIRSYILRHPCSYLYGLYQNNRTKLYIRSFILMVFMSIFYTFL